ncbi:MAG: CHAP domain-containing protein [Thermoanaerobaculia bacterium]|nr:CHAP domain-containing protein [Thermoanaerobaculia bacterium]
MPTTHVAPHPLPDRHLSPLHRVPHGHRASQVNAAAIARAPSRRQLDLLDFGLVTLMLVLMVVLSAVAALGSDLTRAPAPPQGEVDGQLQVQRHRSEEIVEITTSEGVVRVVVLGVPPADIQDVVWGGRSILEAILPDLVVLGDATSTEFTLPAELDLSTPGVLEIWLARGDALVRGIPDDSVLDSRQLTGTLTEAICQTTDLYKVTKCGGTSSSYSVPYKCCDNNYDGDANDSGDGNCVWLAWVRARNRGWRVPSTWGNASRWCDMAAATPGWSVSSTPRVNSIACSKSIGHVAWVTGVDTTNRKFTVQEQNCKVEPSCFGSGTRSKTRDFSSAWKFIRCTDLTKCGA